MAGEIVGVLLLALEALIVFAIIYWAVRLAIRHEKARERKG